MLLTAGLLPRQRAYCAMRCQRRAASSWLALAPTYRAIARSGRIMHLRLDRPPISPRRTNRTIIGSVKYLNTPLEVLAIPSPRKLYCGPSVFSPLRARRFSPPIETRHSRHAPLERRRCDRRTARQRRQSTLEDSGVKSQTEDRQDLLV